MTLNIILSILRPWVIFMVIVIPSPVWSSDLPSYIAGAYTKLLIHELGHAAVAKGYGASDVTIEIPRENASLYSGVTYYTSVSPDTETATFKKVMSVSGLVAANLAGEIVIHQDGLHDNAFAQGILSMFLISNLTHVVKYYTGYRSADGLGNDIDSFEFAGGNPHVLSGILLGYTLWSLKRMSDKSIPLFGINLSF